MTDWTSIKSVLTVVRLGSLSAASRELEIHHTTVLRQINALEHQLQVKLFERQPQGYVATETGQLLADAADLADTHITTAINKIQAIKESSNNVLIITTFPEYAPKLTELIARYSNNGSMISVLISSDERKVNLDSGEAHIGVRAGPKPTEPDYVVQLLENSQCTLCAHSAYIAEHGMMDSLSDIGQHRFLMTYSDTVIKPEMQWIAENVPGQQVVLKTNNYTSFEHAIYSGLGVGPLPLNSLKGQSDVVPVLKAVVPNDWTTNVWIVTHIDMHWTDNVQDFLAFIKTNIER